MTARPAIAVLGSGGHAKVVIATLRAAGYTVAAAFDDDRSKWGNEVLGVRVAGPMEAAADAAQEAVIAIGDNAARKRIAERLRLAWATVIHPSAVVHESARIGAGTVVFAGAVIQPEAMIGEHAIINTAASVDHDCFIGDFAHLAPGVRLAGNVRVGEGAFMGIASAAIPGARIGAWTIVGAGGVVIGDLPERVVAIGVPAKIRREIS